MTWQTERLQIEQMKLQHAEGLYQALKDPKVARYIGGPDLVSVEDAQKRIEFVTNPINAPAGQQWLNFVIMLQEQIIGRLEATITGNKAEIAYLVGPKWWGNGYGLEGTKWLVDYLQTFHVSEFWATVHPENTYSIKLLHNLGFEETKNFDSNYLQSLDEGDLVFNMNLEKR